MLKKYRKISCFSMLYITREKYPTHRVDLTELFSEKICMKGHHIDWVMQSINESLYKMETINSSESVIIGRAIKDNNILSKIRNQYYGFVHDCRIWSLAKRKEYDCIQVRDKFFAALIALTISKKNNTPFFYWMSFPYPEADVYRVTEFFHQIPIGYRLFYLTRGYITGWLLYKIVLRFADHIFVQSDRMKEDVIKKGIDSNKITPVPMGVTFRHFNNFDYSNKLIGFEDRLVISYVGTMVRVRGIDFIIKAFELVHKRFPKALLLLVGDAPKEDIQYLKEIVNKLDLDKHVIFAGFVAREMAWSYIKESKVCVSLFRPTPILDSTSPTKIIEYLALGRPVVANDHPDQTKTLTESGGGVVVPYDVKAFADGVIELLHDEKKANKMGMCGKKYIEKVRSYESLAKMVENKYLQLLNSPHT